MTNHITFFYRSCPAVGKQIGSTIGRLYTQVTVDISIALQAAQVFQLPVACPVPLQLLYGTTLRDRDLEIAKGYADTLSKKIKSGIKEIKKYLKQGHGIIDTLSGKTSNPVGGQRQVDATTTYDVIIGTFLEDAKRYQSDSWTSKFLVWCANFSAGALDYIANSLPLRSVANSETDTRTDGRMANRKYWQRRRTLARVVNTIVHRLPGHSRVIYAALGVKNYYFSPRHGLSDPQLDSIISWVLMDLEEEDLTILDQHPDIYCPVQAITERTQLR
ncbi:hypothetical protein AYO20_00095 [Fonsecaea nubica]|uniref:Uncharacterized protein n=1 Tax=Fonsecaea nubica TaxID=856822 RepID=A0A178DDT9_9EURO|nr:hypothetical protein AYO20_00095 [Fonsecaea nubica]OAL40359.1 hypothetical protein AYO20_00095 [Fonsecaea nubica]